LNKEEIISSGLLELYAMGLASPEEAKEVEYWLSQYPEIKQELDAIEMSLETYAQANAIQPRAEVKSKILAEISQEDKKDIQSTSHVKESIVSIPSAKVYRIPSFFKVAVAASLILLIGSIALTYNYYTKYQSATNELQAAQQKIDQQNQANLAMKNDMNVITDKNSLPVVLKGTPHAPDALAKIFWMKNTGDVYVDPSNLPAVPAGKQYQLWAIVDGKPVDAGMISTEKGIYHIQKMKSFGHAEAFAITMEKAGGSPTPTMDQMYVIAKI
jgi:anti-sigma-K factor RskA